MFQYASDKLISTMNNLPRVPSIEEFDFKLTESVIASPCGTLNAVHLDQQSLAYTVSITSIVEEMPAFLPET